MIDKKAIYDKTIGKAIPEQENYDEDVASDSAAGQLGYSNTNMLKTLTVIIFGLLGLTLIGLLLASIYFFAYKKFSKTLKKVVNLIKNKIFWNTLLRTSI